MGRLCERRNAIRRSEDLWQLVPCLKGPFDVKKLCRIYRQTVYNDHLNQHENLLDCPVEPVLKATCIRKSSAQNGYHLRQVQLYSVSPTVDPFYPSPYEWSIQTDYFHNVMWHWSSNGTLLATNAWQPSCHVASLSHVYDGETPPPLKWSRPTVGLGVTDDLKQMGQASVLENK